MAPHAGLCSRDIQASPELSSCDLSGLWTPSKYFGTWVQGSIVNYTSFFIFFFFRRLLSIVNSTYQ